MIRSFSLLLMFVLILGMLSGCSEREEPGTRNGSTPEADVALKQAEGYLKLAGVKTSFDDPGELTKPEDLVPKPNELASKQKQEYIQKAIEQLNIVISELEQEALLAPSLAPIGSLSDRGFVHFYLGLSYILDAISRILTSDDPETTFILTYDPDAEPGEWFEYDISLETKTKLDDVTDPRDYPLVFTLRERQAIIDAVDLVSDAVVKPIASNIQPQTSSVSGPPYLHSAIWHFEKAVFLLSEYSKDLKQPLEEFNDEIKRLESILEKNAKMWGFTYTSALGR